MFSAFALTKDLSTRVKGCSPGFLWSFDSRDKTESVVRDFVNLNRNERKEGETRGVEDSE